jgi:hypothetical protein
MNKNKRAPIKAFHRLTHDSIKERKKFIIKKPNDGSVKNCAKDPLEGKK